MEPPVWVVKIVEPGNQEAVIYRRLQRNPCRRNHTVPCEIIDSEGHKTILLMPQVRSPAAARLSRWSLSKIMDVFLQVVEAVEYLHEQRIAHMDICNDNTRMATDWEVKMDSRLTAERAYIIDFGTSRQLSLRPGVQPAMPLLYAQVPRPRDMDYFDPYSWDVYCLGKLLEDMAQGSHITSLDYPWCHQVAGGRGAGVQTGLPLSTDGPPGASGTHRSVLGSSRLRLVYRSGYTCWQHLTSPINLRDNLLVYHIG